MTKNVLILPNQLFEINDLVNHDTTVYLLEHPKFFTKYKFHKLKLIFHRSTMKCYQKYLKKKYKCQVKYINFDDGYRYLYKMKTEMYHSNDHEIYDEFKSNCTFHNSPQFLLTFSDMKTFSDKYKSPHHDVFYKWHRKKLDVLMKNDKPLGNKWTYDVENRKSFPDDYNEPIEYNYINNKFTNEAQKYINEKFSDNIGEVDLYLPIDFKASKRHFKKFLLKKLELFGPYQDAVDEDIIFGNHSVISALLNNGLLTPKYVIDKTIKYSKIKKIPLASLEGFIRQIIGWREYVRYMYIVEYKLFKKTNFFNHKRKLNKKIWFKNDDSTGFRFIDDMIDKTFEYSYLHHIERLMYIGNFMLLTETDPFDVLKWFISVCSIDAYEWVMFPNIFGMSQFSSGNIMMKKPYFSSSNYIDKMSNYKKNNGDMIILDKVEYDWNIVYDALYYNFINKNKKYLSSNYATAMQVKHWKNKSENDKKNILMIAKKYFNEYNL